MKVLELIWWVLGVTLCAVCIGPALSSMLLAPLQERSGTTYVQLQPPSHGLLACASLCVSEHYLRRATGSQLEIHAPPIPLCPAISNHLCARMRPRQPDCYRNVASQAFMLRWLTGFSTSDCRLNSSTVSHVKKKYDCRFKPF